MPHRMKTMRVLCIEGCHGVGKSSLLAGLATRFCVFDEMFTDMPSYSFISSQSLPQEFIWVANWFQRLLRTYETDYKPIVFADRSPFSAVYYSKSSPAAQNQLKQLISAMIKELAEKNIVIETVCVSVSREVLWRRISHRLLDQPFREKYNEGSRQWMEQTWAWFDSFSWDHVIYNDEDVADNFGSHLMLKLQQVGVVPHDDE